jgi:hypothetical protein
MSWAFNITNPGMSFSSILTSAEGQFVTDLYSLAYATGDILYYDGAALTRLPIGTNGHVLKVTTGLPAWGAAAGGGSMDDFLVGADSGTPETIADGNTLTIAGGTGIDTSVAATDTVTIALDSATQTSLGKADTASQPGHTHTAANITDFDAEVSNNTDVAANTSARHSAVTLAGTPDYITLAGQQLTLLQIDLATDVTGDLPFANIAEIATSRILGRATAGNGNIEELTGATVRDLIGLDTDDSPQFTGVNIGHATDTTITRVSAGVIAVEGATVVTVASSPTLGTITTTGTIELGNASDTTLSRSAAGVLAVEGVAVPTISSTSTLTNKRVNPRTASSTTDANLTPDLSSANVYYRTTQTGTLAINAPIGTPVIGETIMIYIDSAGAQTVNFNATYKAFGAAFPATTTAGKTMMISAQFNGTDWKTLVANAM